MELGMKLVLWVHLVSLALAGCSAFAGPLVLSMRDKAIATEKPVFGQVTAKLASLGRMALVLMILSGAVLLWGKYDGFVGQNGWFHLKMTLVVLLAALMIFGIFNGRRARAGDAAASARMPLLAKTGMGLVLAIIFSAVFAFS